MDTKKDKIRESIMLCLLAVSPILIGYLFNVMLYIPVIGDIWMYAGPFTLLLFWGWVGTVYMTRFRSIWKAVILGNVIGILCFVVFAAIVGSGVQSEFTYLLTVIAQMYTLPLGFLTMWLAVITEGAYDLAEASISAVMLVQAAGVILMLIAFTIGCITAKKKSISGE